MAPKPPEWFDEEMQVPSWATYRQYCYLKLSCDESVVGLAKQVGFEPSHYRDKGTVISRGKSTFTTKVSVWNRESGLPDTEDLEQHIDALLGLIEAHREGFLELPSGIRKQLVCVTTNLQAFSFELDTGLAKRSAELGLSFWFDFYCLKDPHAEIARLKDCLERGAGN